MPKLYQLNCFILLSILILASSSKDLIEIELNQIKRGSLTTNEYDYFVLNIPNVYSEDANLIIELEPNQYLDRINNIVSDPNLYISKTVKMPSVTENTWKSERFGDETILIGSADLSPSQQFYISVHCKEKCNYSLKVQLIKDIIIKENEKNNFNINPKTVTKYSFTTREDFNELYIYVIGSYINSFCAYLAKENPSSSNTLEATPILFNGYIFKINKFNNVKDPNTKTQFSLIIDNEDENQDISIWLQYDNEKILVKEADILYDSIPQNKAHCYYYPIDYFNKDKEIILSTNLFNGKGFIYISGFSEVNANSIKSTDNNKENSFNVIESKVIKLTKENFKNYGKFNDKEQNFLNFCYFAETASSISLRAFFLEHYKKFQALNIIYAGIKADDIIPKKGIKKYKLEHFNIEQDINIFSLEKSGAIKVYLFMAKPEQQSIIIDNTNFEVFKKNNQIIEAQKIHKVFYLAVTKEMNKCLKNPNTGLYLCYLNIIVQCTGEEDCAYDLAFDHSKKEIDMEAKQIYSSVISENELDFYNIIIQDDSVKNIAIVLMQNSGRTLLRLKNFNSQIGVIDLNEEAQNGEFLPNLIKISNEKFELDNLKGVFSLAVKGLSYASYSLYYYTFNTEENEDYLDQDKIAMKLEKGKIIKDIIMNNHKFKVYMYDSSIIGNKTNLYIDLVENDYINLELFVFKDLNDFSIYDNKINGYLWKGDFQDYIYIDKNDKNYIVNDILYILIFKKSSYSVLKNQDEYASFYLGITDENTPFLLNEGIEFKHQLNNEHTSQKFYYYFVGEEEEQDLQISLSLFYGQIIANIKIENNKYDMNYKIEYTGLITIKKEDVYKYCENKKNCGIEIEIENDNSYLLYSSFLISAKSSKNAPIYMTPGIITQRTLFTGEDQHLIIDIEPEKNYGARISAMFRNGQGEIYVRRALRSEMFETTKIIFPDQDNYEYMISYRNSRNDFYFIQIPASDFVGISHCRLLITVRGNLPGLFYTKIEYTIFVSSNMFNIGIDKNYRLFISKGEIVNFHFKVGNNIKRLYISMTNKDKNANMFLTNDLSISNIYQYEWRSSGGYNEYIDLSVNDQYFIEHGLNDLDGEYYLAIQGLEDTFYNLYISSQEVKIITITEEIPGSCICESENDNCYFRYENINNNDELTKNIVKKNIIFYTEFTYGDGSLYAKLYKNGNMKDILNNLPSKTNYDIKNDGLYDFLLMDLEEKNKNYTYNSVIVVGVQCKQKSLFDLSAVLLDSSTDVSKNSKNFKFLKYNQDNIFYLSFSTGLSSKFIYYINQEDDLNYQIKAMYGEAQIFIYTNDTASEPKFIGSEDNTKNNSNYHHISDAEINKKIKGKSEFYGKVPKKHGYQKYLYIEVKPTLECLINININFDSEMIKIPLNKEIIGIIDRYNYDAYFDFSPDLDEVIITVTGFDKDRPYDVYLKTNIIKKGPLDENDNDNKEDIIKYSKASSKNYDMKGRTNDITGAVSLKIKNLPQSMRTEFHSVRILINVESLYLSNGRKIKIMITPIMNSVTRFKPEQNVYYFSDIEKKYIDKTIFNLKNMNIEDDLMIIEISACKGDFLYTITDTSPLDIESYSKLQEKRIPSQIYSSNGKTIITLRDLEIKEYYLTLFGANNKKEMNLFIDEEEEKKDQDAENNVDILFHYYTTNIKNFDYLITNDSLIYKSLNEFNSIKIIIPESKKRNAFGIENDVDSMNYTLFITDQEKDYIFMESTCYLSKLIQNNQNNKFEYLKINYDKKNNEFKVNGLKAGKAYYMNILGRNIKTGEIITYKPIMVVLSMKAKIFIIVFLVIIIIIFLCGAFTMYRKYRLQKLQLDFVEENISADKDIPKKIEESKNIDLDFIKTDDNDSINLNEEKKA